MRHNYVQITNGLDEGLHVVAQAAKIGRPDFEAIVVEPAFEMYAACIAAVRASATAATVTGWPGLGPKFSARGVFGRATRASA